MHNELITLTANGRGRLVRWDDSLPILLGRSDPFDEAMLESLLPLADGTVADMTLLESLCQVPRILHLACASGVMTFAATARRGRWRLQTGRDVILSLSPQNDLRAIGPDGISTTALTAVAASGIVAVFAPDGTIRAVNDTFLTAFAQVRQDVVGEDQGLLVSADEAHSTEHRRFWRSLRDGVRWSGTKMHRDRAGTPVWLLCDYVPLLDGNGEVTEILLSGRLMTLFHDASRDAESKIRALDNSLAVIEFAPEGTIVAANDKFLEATGYDRPEIVGRHHRIFVDFAATSEADHERFWGDLRRGECTSGVFLRVGKNGRKVWMQATYNPVLDDEGRVAKVVTFALDTTERVEQDALTQGQIEALHRSSGVIQFGLDGSILEVNESFLAMMGFERPDQIVGKHHSMFLGESYAHSSAYKEFWARLRAGQGHSAEILRRGRNGQAVWLQASYNPILDSYGRVVRIVNFASNITAAKQIAAGDKAKLTAIDESQAMIEFDLEGRVLDVNDIFLEIFGYDREDVIGRHHAIFCDREYVASQDYRTFWAGLREGTVRSGEFTRRAKDGSEVWIRGAYNPVRDATGKPVGILKFATDITREIRIRHRGELLSLLTDGIANSMVMTDAQGRIEYVNPGFADMTGFTLDEVRGRKPGDFLQGPKTSRETIARVRQKLAMCEPFYEEILNYHRNGQPYWISLAINPIFGSDGSVERFVSIQSNIDRTKRESLEFTRRLEAISSNSAVAEWNAAGQSLTVNRYLGERGGKPTAFDVILPPGERACIKSGETIRRPVEWPCEDGTMLMLDAVFNTVKDDAGELSKVLMFGIDTTERHTLINGALSAPGLYQSDRGHRPLD